MAVSTEKISLYSVTELKNTSDDAIPAYLNSLKFKQSHTVADIRLVIGYASLLIAAATFSWDYKFGFEATKLYTAFAVGLYATLSIILSLYSTYVEKGTIYIGTNAQDDEIRIETKVEECVPIYNLRITTKLKSCPGEKPKVTNLKKPFNKWFDKAGHFVALPFQQMLASSIPMIDDADKARKNKCVESSDKESSKIE
ncbi:Bgt-2450 [Blumeria graminis f. sp. tritici]|uniref:Signal peptidase complex subunit 2 n=2 Tax=Blumeria graminis f. sp. tritici TaxID=62690 RepID=A0A061HP60_BLUGR|nr:Subunit of signal peptidase complex [Blumeria graminis f. sp. tritici 96224]VDB93661.1 Bgt-2450 [Blumeria graminis f. sp. tritici]